MPCRHSIGVSWMLSVPVRRGQAAPSSTVDVDAGGFQTQLRTPSPSNCLAIMQILRLCNSNAGHPGTVIISEQGLLPGICPLCECSRSCSAQVNQPRNPVMSILGDKHYRLAPIVRSNMYINLSVSVERVLQRQSNHQIWRKSPTRT